MYYFLKEEIEEFERIFNSLKNGKNQKSLYKIDSVLQPILNKEHNKMKIFGYESLFRIFYKDKEIVPFSIPMYIYFEQFIDKYLFLTRENLLNIFNKAKKIIPGKKIFINISLSRDILNKELFSLIEKSLSQINSFYANNIVFEILENDKIFFSQTKFEEAIEKIKYLRSKYRIQIALDDYGTGNSNFDKLLYMKPDYLKIDGCFVKEINNNAKIKKTVEHLISICKIHEILTIAEYVENKEILETADTIGFDLFQGFYFQGKKLN